MKRLAQAISPVLELTILGLVVAATVLSRVFSVIRYESIIHEFDPWFNYRTSQFLVSHSLTDFWNYFDSDSWYPLGRDVGGTVYPGLMLTSGLAHLVLARLGLPVDIR
jgi:dolichyl-diphosphooligosaccharide--protein glycosyltransferase